MKLLFADSFYYIAFFNPKDRAHAKALSISKELEGVHVYTTDWVLTEVADAFAAPPNRHEFARLYNVLAESLTTTIVGFDATLFAEGIELYDNRPDKLWSLTDCISFVVMTRQGIINALTGDQHFTQAGFTTLF